MKRTLFASQIRSIQQIVLVIISVGMAVNSCVGQATDAATTVDLNPFRSCGLNCLFLVARMSGHATTLSTLEQMVGPQMNGESSIADLERAAVKLGLNPLSIRLEIDDLQLLPLPAIVHYKTQARQSDASHYVVLIGLHRDGVIVIDPPAGATLHPYSEFAAEWTGVAIAFPANLASRDQFLTNLWWREAWSVWPTRIAIVLSIIVFGRFCFKGTTCQRSTEQSEPRFGAVT